MAKMWPFKAPYEVLDYGFDWRPRRLGTDMIVATTAEVIEGGVVVDSHVVGAVEGIPAGQATVTTLSGGVVGQGCTLCLRITTAAGRKMTQTVKIKIKER